MSSHGVLLSYVIPAYNASAHLEQCLQSIFQQKLPRASFEVILVNDGSSDATLEIAERWRSQWPELKVISQQNKGQSAARNLGMEIAIGAYIWFVDADDYIFDNSAQTLLNTAMANDLDVLTFQVCEVSAGTPPNEKFNVSLLSEDLCSGTDYIARYNYNNGPWLYLFKSIYARQNVIKFIEGRYCEDGMFTMSLLARAERVAHYPSPAYVYIQHITSTTKNRSPEHFLKLADDFVYAIAFIDAFIKTERSNLKVSPAYLARLEARRDSYTFFLCGRLLRSTLKSVEITSRYNQLLEKGWVPLKHFSRAEYPGFKFNTLKLIFNSPMLFFLASIITRLTVK